MIIDGAVEDSLGMADQECGLMTSPMNLGYFYGNSPAPSEQSCSPGSQLSPRSPSSDCESTGSWYEGSPEHSSTQAINAHGEAPMGGGRQQSRHFQGVRVKNSVKELLELKRSAHKLSVTGKVLKNSNGAAQFTDLKTILREGKRHSPDCLFDTPNYKKSATFHTNVLTPPQTPNTNDYMEPDPQEGSQNLETDSSLLDIFQVLREGSSSPLSLTTVQVNWENPSQGPQDLNPSALPPEGYNPGPVLLGSSLSQNHLHGATQSQNPEVSPYSPPEMLPPCSGSGQSGSPFPPQTPFAIPSQMSGLGAPQFPDQHPANVFRAISPLGPEVFSAPNLPLVHRSFLGPGGMSFFQWQIEQEERKLAGLSEDCLVTRDSDGDTFLHIAVAQGRRALSYVLARKMAAIGMLDVKEHNGQSALQVSVAANQHLIVQDLLNMGAQINTADCWGRTPLHVCAEKGHATTLQAIHKAVQANGQHLDLEAINYDGMTAMHTAILSHNAVVQELYKSQKPHSPHGQQLLQRSKLLGECVSTLLQMGASFKTKDRKSGRTALHMAAEEANVELLRLFLDQPDSLSVVNDKVYSGNTALHIVSALQDRVAQVDAVRLLMRKGGDPSVKNLENEQPAQLVPDGPVGEQVRRILKGKGTAPRSCPF
nr:PREDICTED: NF-kappa-B inhibitor zeta isoform X1 [Lepisosteus oculatus]